jgi:hypothetical protein
VNCGVAAVLTRYTPLARFSHRPYSKKPPFMA